jgi:hypothetical protein
MNVRVDCGRERVKIRRDFQFENAPSSDGRDGKAVDPRMELRRSTSETISL